MMNPNEFRQIRVELEHVQRRVARLTQRLDALEARERAIPEVPATMVEKAKATPHLPPPLPTAPVAVKITVPVEASAPVMAKLVETPVSTKPSPLPIRPLVPPPPPKAPRRFGPPEGMGWEMALTTYWLPRIGVLMLALGVVWGLTLASDLYRDHPLMPLARVSLGYLIAGVLGGTGWKLENKYPGYARVLMGGGFGLLYFVTFATWYIPQTRIAPSQEFTLLLLALLVTAWGAVAQWRKSQLIALSMTLLGHFTVALSTLSLDSPSRAAVGGLLILGIGSAFFLVRNGWYAVAMSAMIGSYLNQFFWLAQAPPSGAPMDFAIGMMVLATYLVLYALADRMTPYEHAAARTRTRNIYCGLNTGGFLILGLALMQGFSFARESEYLLYFTTALFAAGMGWSYALRPVKVDDRAHDGLSNIYFTKASMLTTAGFAAWLDGPSVTLSIALQALALLAAARRSQRPVGRILALGTALVAFAHGGYVLAEGGLPRLGDPGFTGYALAALLTASVFWAIAELYRMTPWHTFPKGPWRGPESFRDICAGLEMVEHKNGAPIQSSRMFLSHGLVAFGVLLAAGNVQGLFPLYHAAPALCLLGLVAAVLGLVLRSAPILAGCAFFLGVGLIWLLQRLFGGNPHEPNTTLMIATCATSFLVVSELFRRLLASRLSEFEQDGSIQGAWKRNHALIAIIAAAGAAIAIAAGFQERAEPEIALHRVGVLALAATIYAFARSAPNFGFLGVLMVLFTALLSPQLDSEMVHPWMPVVGALLAALSSVAGETQMPWGHCPGLAFHRLRPAPYLLYGAAAWNTIWLADAFCAEYALPSFLVLAATAFAAGLLLLHPRAMASLGAALMTVALVVWLSDGGPVGSEWWHTGAFLIVALSLAGDRFLSARNPFVVPGPARMMLCCAWILCVAWSSEMLHSGGHYTGLAVIAISFLAYAAAFRTRTAGVLSLLAAVLATGPLLLDPSQGMPLGTLWAAYASLIVYWIAAERGLNFVLTRTNVKLAPGHATTLTVLLAGIPTLLGVLCVARIDAIQNFYLTMAWTTWGLAIFCWALVTRQSWFRYMGLAVFALALSRAFFVDVWRLEGLYRVGAMLFLGTALLAVAYGYTRWRASQIGAEATTREGEKE